jgi:hypothetical protein
LLSVYSNVSFPCPCKPPAYFYCHIPEVLFQIPRVRGKQWVFLISHLSFPWSLFLRNADVASQCLFSLWTLHFELKKPN